MNSFIEYIADAKTETPCPLPLFLSHVEAGFPSPADDYIEEKLDLNEHLIDSPSSTFFFRVSGESMTGIGVFPNDLLIVDRSITPKHKSIIVALLDGGLIIKRLYKWGGKLMLQSENPAFPDIIISEEQEFEVWGVVKSAVHEFE